MIQHAESQASAYIPEVEVGVLSHSYPLQNHMLSLDLKHYTWQGYCHIQVYDVDSNEIVLADILNEIKYRFLHDGACVLPTFPTTFHHLGRSFIPP